MKIAIIIPTYNEAENIGRLIEVLSEEFKKNLNNSYSVLVVEANSPDGTGEVVKEKALKFDFIHMVVEEKKRGLGAAYVFGFKHALANIKPDVLLEMDADFQHDPKDVIRLVREVENGNDYVIGSRFMRGGSIPKEWQFRRKLLSFGGNLFSKIVLGIFNVNDFTSGFKASRVSGFVDKLDLENILSDGFAYKIDLLFKMHRLGAKIKEVPIKFGLRDRGDSKMEKNNFIDSIRVVLTLRFNENKNLFKFLAVGLIGLAVDTGLFNLLRIALVPSGLCALISGALAMITTFMLNNHWSFKERKLEGLKTKIVSLVVYVVSSSVPILVRSKLVDFATVSYGDTFLVSNIAFFIGITFGLVWNFTIYSKIIWRVKKS